MDTVSIFGKIAVLILVTSRMVLKMDLENSGRAKKIELSCLKGHIEKIKSKDLAYSSGLVETYI